MFEGGWFISTHIIFLFHQNRDGIWRRYSRKNNNHYMYLPESLIFPEAPSDELLRTTIKHYRYFIEIMRKL